MGRVYDANSAGVGDGWKQDHAETLSFYQNIADASAAKNFGKQLGLTLLNTAANLTCRNDKYRIKPGEATSYYSARLILASQQNSINPYLSLAQVWSGVKMIPIR